MTSLTSEEKEALKEVFLCFQTEEKWYHRGIFGKIVFSRFFYTICKTFSNKYSKIKHQFLSDFFKN